MLGRIARVRQVKRTLAMAELGRINAFVAEESKKLEQLNDFCDSYTIKNQLMDCTVSSVQLENQNLFVGTLITAKATQQVRVEGYQKVLDSKKIDMHKLEVELNRLNERIEIEKSILRSENQKKQDMQMQDSFNSVKYYDR